MNSLEFDELCELLRERSGLVLSADKQYLLENRLLPVANRAGLASLSALAQRLRSPDAEPLKIKVIEAMTTNETFFFRDDLPFQTFRTVIMPRLMAARSEKRQIRIWCAASSTGQEPYSLAMILAEMDRLLHGWRVDILATDLSGEVLEKAKAGIYTHFEVQRGLPIKMLIKYFTNIGEAWEIKPELRARVEFRQLNLLNDFKHLGTFDVVFCRNVLIYFEVSAKTAFFERLSRVIASDGHLVLGGAETVVGLTTLFKPAANSIGLYVPAALQSRVLTTAPVANAHPCIVDPSRDIRRSV